MLPGFFCNYQVKNIQKLRNSTDLYVFNNYSCPNCKYIINWDENIEIPIIGYIDYSCISYNDTHFKEDYLNTMKKIST